jgi:hypothetical protein
MERSHACWQGHNADFSGELEGRNACRTAEPPEFEKHVP